MDQAAPRYGKPRTLYQSALHMAALLLAAATMSQAAIAAPKTIIAYGDSLMAGYQLRPGEGFAPQLEAALKRRGHAVTVVPAGVSGDTTSQGKARIDWVLAGVKAKGLKPDLVILELGANDMLRGQSPAAAKANLEAMLIRFKALGAPVLLAGMRASPNLGAPYTSSFDAMYPALAKAHGVPLYPFFMDGVAAVPGLQLGDGMHPTPAGVAVIVRRILPAVEKALGR